MSTIEEFIAVARVEDGQVAPDANGERGQSPGGWSWIGGRTIAAGVVLAGGLVASAAFGPALVYADYDLVPSLSVSERYDSNVFFAPPSFVPGQTLWDFVTTITPQVEGQYKGRFLDASLIAGAGANMYVNNPGLNFFSTNGALNLGLDNLAARLWRGARLKISDYLLYTPEPPAFLSPAAEQQASDAYVRGIQTFRANSISNTASASGALPLTQTVDLEAGYSYSFLHYGNTLVAGTQNALLNTSTQTASVGTAVRVTPRDTARLGYTYAQNLYVGFSSFTTHTISLDFVRAVSRTLRVALGGGPVLIQPVREVNYSVTASLSWDPGANDSISLSYNRRVSPSYFLVATSLVNEMVSVSMRHKVGSQLAVGARGNYATSEATDGSGLGFTSYGANVSLEYQVTRDLQALLSYDYSDFNNQLAAGQSYTFNRNVVTLTLKGLWH